MIEVNARYVRLIDLLMGLATGSLVLPPLFLRTFLGVTNEPVAIFLDTYSLLSMGSFATTIGLSLAYHFVSAKWIKNAWGQHTILNLEQLQTLLTLLISGVVLSFALGIAFFVQFVRRT